MKCNIIAPINTDISALKRILVELNIEYFDPIYEIKTSEKWSNVVVKGLREADFILAVYSSTSQETFFELGICYGLGKKIFLIVPTEESLPTMLSDTVYVRADSAEHKKLKFSLQNFISQFFPKHHFLTEDDFHLNSDHVYDPIELSRQHQQQKRWDEAEMVLQRALESAPTNAQMWLELSKMYQHQRRWDEAEMVLQRAIRNYPANSTLRIYLARLYEKLNKLDEAENTFLQILKSDKKNAQARKELSVLYKNQNKIEKAERIIGGAYLKDRLEEISKLTKANKLVLMKGLLRECSNSYNHQAFEQLIRQLFNYIDVEIAIDSRVRKTAAKMDFSVWIDELNNSIGNPIFIETKYGKLDEHNVKKSIGVMKQWLQTTNAMAGLLLYKDVNGKIFDRLNSLDQSIFVVSIDFLIDTIDKKTFSALLLDMKSQWSGQEF